MIFFVISGLLGAAIVTVIICEVVVLFEAVYLHSRIETEDNITTICCINAITDGVVERYVVVLCACGWCEDKHAEVRQ